jgi:hypothetical protein
MGSLTDFAEQALLDHVFNGAGQAYTPPTNIYLALCTADPTDAATGASMNECANSGSYARTEITVGAASSRRVTQDALVTFPQASGSWGTVTHWAIVDTNTYGSGNVLAHGAFATGKPVVSGNTPSVASTEVYVEFSAGEISNYLANALLDHMFNNSSYTQPSTYVAACTATVADGDTGSTITEPSGNGYARKLVNANGGAAPAWALATGTTPAVVDNGANVDLGPASGGNWGTIVAVAIVDASSAGNLLMYDNDMSDQAVNDGDTMRFPTGDLDMQMS